jgi:hypothetical protein
MMSDMVVSDVSKYCRADKNYLWRRNDNFNGGEIFQSCHLSGIYIDVRYLPVGI